MEQGRAAAAGYVDALSAPQAPALNRGISERLLEAAHLLELQDASPYRVHAYRRAGESIARYPRDIRAIFESEGVKGLDAIPHVGLGIASAVAELLVTRRWSLLDRLRGSTQPGALLQSVPGVGRALARRIHEELHVDSLEDFEAATRDGRLAGLAGIGSRRLAAWRAALAAMLGRAAHEAPAASRTDVPPIALILDVDREYREGAAAGRLRLIAPRRFNPDHEAWLPILHTQRGPWHFTALFSNTELAHRLRRTRDWVVLYYYDGDHVERRCTIVTEPRGPLAGRRVVRGREAECDHFHAPGLAAADLQAA